MSNKHLVKISSTIAMGFVAGFASMKLYQSRDVVSSHFTSRAPQSTMKPLFLGKHHMITTVKAVVPQDIPEKSNELTEIEGYITLNEEVDRPLFWEWSLPEGVQVVKGLIKGYEQSPQAGHTYKVSLTVNGFSKEEKKVIVLSGYIDFDSSRSGNSTTVSSNPESSFEFIAPALKAEVDLDKLTAKQSSEKLAR